MCATHLCFFFFNDTATTEIYTLSLHDALPIYVTAVRETDGFVFMKGEESQSPDAIEARHLDANQRANFVWLHAPQGYVRSEEHTSELQSRLHLVCRLLLEKKKQHSTPHQTRHR